MNDENRPFGMREIKNKYDRYKGKYILINTARGSTFSGHMIDIEDGSAILNPHTLTDYTSGEPISKLIDNPEVPELVDLTNASITPTSKENIEAYCEYQTKHYNNHKEKSKE